MFQHPTTTFEKLEVNAITEQQERDNSSHDENEFSPLLSAIMEDSVYTCSSSTAQIVKPDETSVSQVEEGIVNYNVSDSSLDGEINVKLPKHDQHASQSNITHPTSNLESMVHLLKGNIGTGILAMPDAFSNAGLLVGTLGIPIMGIICVHCMHILVNSAAAVGKRMKCAPLGYAEVAEAAFRSGPAWAVKWAKFARRLINVFLCITQLGFCCVYFVFVATSLKQLVEYYFPPVSLLVYEGCLLIPMIALNCIRRLKYLSPVSLLANILQLAGLICIFYYVLQDLPPSWTRKATAPLSQLPLYFGTAIYAFEGIGVVLPIQNQMRTPSAFQGLTGVLNTGMVIVACLYTAVGFYGYLKYGDDVQGSITLDLPAEDILAQLVKLSMAVAIFLSYALQFYVPVEIIWPHLVTRFHGQRNQLIAEYVFRALLVLFTCCLAAAIPNLGLFISLVGAVSSSFLALIFPPVLDTILNWDQMGFCRWLKNIFIMLFGTLGFITGTYASVREIVIEFSK